MENWYTKKHSEQVQNRFIQIINQAIKDYAREDFLFLIYRYLIEMGQEDKRILDRIANAANWDYNKREEIWQLCQIDERYYILPGNMNWDDKKSIIFEEWKSQKNYFLLPTSINWENEKEEIWEICRSYKGLWHLPQNVDWNDKKEEIWEGWKSSEYKWKLPASINWENEKEEIWEAWKKEKLKWDLPEYIDWSDRKEEIWAMWEKDNTRWFLPSCIDWDEKEDILEKYKREYRIQDILDCKLEAFGPQRMRLTRYIEIIKKYINWENSEEVYDFICVLNKHNSIYNRKFQETLQKNNPIYNQSIFKSLNFDKCPWLTDNPDNLTEENIQEEKVLLLEIFDRLDRIGFIDHAIDLENNNFEKSGFNFTLDITQIREQLEGLTDKVEITAILAFYLNKLTKVNEITMYANALNGFKYNEIFDGIIENNQGNSLPKEVEEYKSEKDVAEEKGSRIISTLKYLRGNNSNPIPRNDNFAYLMRQAENIQSGNFSTYNLPMKSFTEFLNYWKDTRDENGYLKIENNSRLRDFVNAFNENVRDLLEEGCTLDEITNSFIYSSQALDLEDKLYEVKVCLLQQLIEYSKKEEYQGKLSVQYEEHKSLGFEEIYELWKNDDNRDESGKFKSNFQAEYLSEKVRDYFNEEIQKLISQGYSIDDIKNGISNNANVFQKFKLDIESFQKENIDSKTRDILYILMDNYLFPMSFHTNIEELSGVRSLLKKVHPDIKDYSDDESVNVLYFIDAERYDKYLKQREELEFDKILNQSYAGVLSNQKNIISKRNFDKNKDEFYSIIKSISKYIGVISEGNDFEISSENKAELLNSLINYTEENSQNPNMKKKTLMAKVATYLLKRENIRCDKNDPMYIEFQNNLEELKELTNKNPEEALKVYRLLDLKQNILLGSRETEVELQTEVRSGNEEYLSLKPEIKNMVENLIENGTTIEYLKIIGFSGTILDYAEYYQNELKNKTIGREEKRPGAEASRKMTRGQTLIDVNHAENEIMSSIENTNEIKKD